MNQIAVVPSSKAKACAVASRCPKPTSVKVLLPTPLAGYTANRREVEAEGANLADGDFGRARDGKAKGSRADGGKRQRRKPVLLGDLEHAAVAARE